MKKNTKRVVPPHHIKRQKYIAQMLKEMRFADGKTQSCYEDFGVSRRQIQRGEQGSNLSLISLFKLLDAFGYRLDEFFEGME
jgi:transcriptional regulator with XRE-family HTH domain